MAIEADDRDAMNEAAVLVHRSEDVLPSWLGNKNRRCEQTHWRWHRVEADSGSDQRQP